MDQVQRINMDEVEYQEFLRNLKRAKLQLIGGHSIIVHEVHPDGTCIPIEGHYHLVSWSLSQIKDDLFLRGYKLTKGDNPNFFFK